MELFAKGWWDIKNVVFIKKGSEFTVLSLKIFFVSADKKHVQNKIEKS